MKYDKIYDNLIRFDNLDKCDSLLSFSTTIIGGISTGNYSTFNLGLYSEDKVESVLENRNRLATALGINFDKLYLPYQTHQDNICIIDKDFLSKSEDEKKTLLSEIDALITNEKGICIGVTTADCVPIIIYDSKLKVLATIHAGWKGTVAKIAPKVVQKMKEIYSSNPSDIKVAIAPSISQTHFEVGEEVVEKFFSSGFPMNIIGYRNTDSGKMHISLQTANKLLLEEAGIPENNIEISRLCTYSNPDLLFSARRQTIYSGRMVTGGIIK